MIKKGLKVKVLTGKDTTKEKKGGIVSKENFIHLSNLKLISEKSKKKEAKK